MGSECHCLTPRNKGHCSSQSPWDPGELTTDVVEPIIHEKISIPGSIKILLDKQKKSVKMDVNYENLKDYLLK